MRQDAISTHENIHAFFKHTFEDEVLFDFICGAGCVVSECCQGKLLEYLRFCDASFPSPDGLSEPYASVDLAVSIVGGIA